MSIEPRNVSIALNNNANAPKDAWRFLAGIACSIFFCSLFFGVAAAAFFSGQMIGKHTVSWLSPVVRGAVAIILMILLTWVVRVKINRKPWTGIRLPKRGTAALHSGAAFGAGSILLVFAVEYALGWIHFARVAWQTKSGLPNLLAIGIQLIPSLGTGLTEELTFRGYIFQTMAERSRVWVAALVSLLLFGIVHIFGTPGINVADLASIITIGLSFLVMRFVTGSLWFPIGFHAMFDWTQTYLLGMSGDSGPDPSLIQFHLSGPPIWVGSDSDPGLLYPAVALLALGLAMLYARRKGIRIPWEPQLDEEGEAC